MLPYCWSVEKKEKVKNQKMKEKKKEEQCFHQDVQCVTVRNQDLLTSKMLEDFLSHSVFVWSDKLIDKNHCITDYKIHLKRISYNIK